MEKYRLCAVESVDPPSGPKARPAVACDVATVSQSMGSDGVPFEIWCGTGSARAHLLVVAQGGDLGARQAPRRANAWRAVGRSADRRLGFASERLRLSRRMPGKTHHCGQRRCDQRRRHQAAAREASFSPATARAADQGRHERIDETGENHAGDLCTGARGISQIRQRTEIERKILRPSLDVEAPSGSRGKRRWGFECVAMCEVSGARPVDPGLGVRPVISTSDGWSDV